ncbi:MAG: glycosyltransferase family 39 protein [Butyrivibrio sp.]|nr:glycosyltransferase family 39 protein [Butyrivibrio sp.]
MQTIIQKLNIKSIVFAAFSVLCFFLRLEVFSETPVLNLFYGIAYILGVLLLAILYHYIDNLSAGHRKYGKFYTAAPAALFTFFMIFGYSFLHDNSWNLVVSSDIGQLCKTIAMSAGYFFFFYHMISWLYIRIDSPVKSSAKNTANIRFAPLRWYLEKLRQKPFTTAFVSLFIVYFPFAIVSYPAFFVINDTRAQIVQAYSELGIVAPAYLEGHMISDTVFMNTHHPPVHTLLIHLCLVIGNHLFHSANAGIFLYTAMQCLCVLTAVAYAVKVLVEKLRVPISYAVFMLLYYIISPLIQGYMIVVTKDILYAVFLLYFLIALYFLYLGEKSRKLYAALFLSALGMLLFRNDAKYLFLLSFLIIAFFYKKLRKTAMCFVICVLCFSILYSSILSLCGVTRGSIREMFSVPFQQTARYVKYHEEDITEEQKQAINNILNYSSIAIRYSVNLSDGVKGLYREDASKEDLIRYFKVWFEMLGKHPGTYIQATMNNYYSYFYPVGNKLWHLSFGNSIIGMDIVNEQIVPLGMYFYYPESLEPYRNAYEHIEDLLVTFPPIAILMLPSAYTWTLILLFFYALRKKSKNAVAFLMIPCMIILVCCLLGPCNGHYGGRYLYPIILSMPLLLPMTIRLTHQH